MINKVAKALVWVYSAGETVKKSIGNKGTKVHKDGSSRPKSSVDHRADATSSRIDPNTRGDAHKHYERSFRERFKGIYEANKFRMKEKLDRMERFFNPGKAAKKEKAMKAYRDGEKRAAEQAAAVSTGSVPTHLQ